MGLKTRATYEEFKSILTLAGQSHILTYWDRLDDQQRADLLDDLASIDFAAIPEISKTVTTAHGRAVGQGDVRPAKVVHRSAIDPRAAEVGRGLIEQGKIAALTVAGGQGTRLGFDGPKGAFPISPVRNKPLFQLFAESIVATRRRYRAEIAWYIMTSPHNDAATRRFFVDHDNFGLPESDLLFFRQGVMPSFDRAGRILLNQPHRIALSPDGHGGTLLALARSGMLADMARRGVEHISYFQVDNPLVYCVDPVFIGLHSLLGSEMSSKTLPKADDFEKVGNFAVLDGKLTVIEYSDLDEQLARVRNPDGSRTFDAANIAIHLLSRRFVERLTENPSAFALPWHVAHKKVPCIDLGTGARIEPAQPNGIKVEAFIFDALPLARNPILLETSRAEEFSPVKNATGVDSIDTARRDMSRRAAAWLHEVGVNVPRDDAGEPDGRFEISPLRALDADALRSDSTGIPAPSPGGCCYIE